MGSTLRHCLTLFAFAGGLAGCTQFPELDAVQTPGVASAPYPDLLPIETLLSGDFPQVSGAEVAAIEGRAAALRARADRLQGAFVGPGGVDSRLLRLRRKAADLRMQ